MARPKKVDRHEVLARTRNRLLQAAAVEFAQEGYVGANINRISLAAGFAKGTIYNHFPSKRELMLSLVEQVASVHIATILEQIESDQSPAQRLLAFFQVGFTFVEAHPAEARSIINAVYGPDPEFRDRVYQAYEPLFAVIMDDVLGDGVVRGDFRPLDADLTTALIMTVYLGACSQLDADGRIWLDPQQVADFVLGGLLPRP